MLWDKMYIIGRYAFVPQYGIAHLCMSIIDCACKWSIHNVAARVTKMTLPSIVTVKVQLLLFPLPSVAFNCTVCTPIEKEEPDAASATGVMATMELSVTVAGSQNAMPVAKPGSVLFTTSEGHVMLGFSLSEMRQWVL